MIVILTYFADGSGKPEVKFIEDAPEQTSRVAAILLAAAKDGKLVEVYEIEDLTLAPAMITAEDEEAEE